MSADIIHGQLFPSILLKFAVVEKGNIGFLYNFTLYFTFTINYLPFLSITDQVKINLNQRKH